jgi:hypothetical protein
MDEPLRHEMAGIRHAIQILLVDERAHTPRPAAELLERLVGVVDYLFTRCDLLEKRVQKLENPPETTSGRYPTS